MAGGSPRGAVTETAAKMFHDIFFLQGRAQARRCRGKGLGRFDSGGSERIGKRRSGMRAIVMVGGFTALAAVFVAMGCGLWEYIHNLKLETKLLEECICYEREQREKDAAYQ